MTTHRKLRVIYIAGYGRSGSTILDIALGQHPAIFGAGEITALTRHVWERNEYCACGNPIQDCSLWSAIVQQWLDGQEPSLIEYYSSLQRKFESNAGPIRLLSGKAGRRLFCDYAHHTMRLFDAIASVSGNTTIIDSSKIPWRAFALSRIKGIDLHVIHLVRDGRAVAWSLLQRYSRDVTAGLQKDIQPKSTVRTALRWGFVNVATELLCRRLEPDRFLRMCYEDFTADPEVAFQRVGRSLGIDLGHTGAALNTASLSDPVIRWLAIVCG